MDENWINSFREKLMSIIHGQLYIYKFIVPTGQEERVKQLFPLHKQTEKLSKQEIISV
jgi:hypothetical protein